MNRQWILGSMLVGFASGATAQAMSLEQLKDSGIVPLTAAQVDTLVRGARTEWITPDGLSRRAWTNRDDGTFIAGRHGDGARMNPHKQTAYGTWSVNSDGAYCTQFDWGMMIREGWCRQLYRVEGRYYGFEVDAPPDTLSGPYYFTR